MKRMKLFRKLNNQGAGVVAVIVAIALVSILASVVLTTSYTNYKIKETNFKSKTSFYSAETALDEINVGLQGFISKALSDSYREIITNFNVLDADQKQEKMESLFYSELWSDLELAGTNHKKYDTSVLAGFVSETYDVDKQEGVVVSSTNPEMITYDKNGILLKNLTIFYRDKEDYSTFLTTDIRLTYPQISFGVARDIPDILNYAIVADTALVFEEPSDLSSSSEIKGQIYAGEMKTAIMDTNKSINISFTSGEESNEEFTVVSKKDIDLTNSKVDFSSDGILWTGSVILDSSEVTFRGTTNLSNDLELRGNESKATVYGTYNGYGNSTTEADESSAILINGKKSVVDFTNADRVEIAGHAFIGTSGRNTKEGFTAVNVLTGESIAVKSDQLIYLVPGEAIGVSKSDGTVVYGNNPLTEEQYREMIANSTNINEVNLGYAFTSNGDKLSDFADGVIKVYVPIKSNGLSKNMVYYYLKFKSDVEANKYFDVISKLDDSILSKYISRYSDSILVADSDATKFSAGYYYDFSGGVITEVKAPLTGGSKHTHFSGNNENYSKKKQALCTKLVTNSSYLTEEQLNESDTKDVVFENLVDVAKVESKMLTTSEMKFYFKNEEGKNSVLFTNESTYTYPASDSDKELKIIIAKGDVRVTEDFDGLILCNGTLSVKEDVDLGKNYVDVKDAFALTAQIVSGEDTEYVTPYSFMVDGKDLLGGVDDDLGGTSAVSIADLVTYENWEKE